MQHCSRFGKIITVFLMISILTGASSCTDDDPGDIVGDPFLTGTSNFTPVIIARADLEKGIEFQTERPLVNTGKIYSYFDKIFINEKYEGIHVFDNSDPRNPTKIGFIKVPGSIDMAIKNGALYVDNAVDLVAIDITKLPEIQVTQRINNIFPEHTPPDMTWIPFEYQENQRPENTVIIKWESR